MQLVFLFTDESQRKLLLLFIAIDRSAKTLYFKIFWYGLEFDDQVILKKNK